MVCIVRSADTGEGRRFLSAVDGMLNDDLISAFSEILSAQPSKRAAFDCEGVNLCRLGSLEIMSICFPNKEVYLVDFGGDPCPTIVKAVKDLLESEQVTKIIHDCRMDCDTLYHLHDIKVNNVHNTSCFNWVISGNEHKNPNDVIGYNGISVNAKQDKLVYRLNPRFWAQQPMTRKMIDWASSDVDKLFNLADKQLHRTSDSSEARATELSTNYSITTCQMKVCNGLKVKRIGPFIGRGGANIRSLSTRTGTHIYQDHAEGIWFVFYEDKTSLNTVNCRMAM